MMLFFKRLLRPGIVYPVNHPRQFLAIRTLAPALPPTFLGIVVFPGLAWGSSTVTWLTTRPVILFCCAFAGPILLFLMDVWQMIGDYVKARELDNVPAMFLPTILSAITVVVEAKMDRFGQTCKSLLAAPPDPAVAFEKLTQPQLQITELAKGLYTSMKRLADVPDLHMVLVKVSKGKPVEYVEYLPQGLRPDENLLQARDSFFKSVIDKGQFSCIPDIPKYLQRNRGKMRRPKTEIKFHSGIGEEPKGSICGIPLRHSHLGKIVYVLTFCSKQPDVINKSWNQRYPKLWKYFTDRIVLEHSLKEIKEYAFSDTHAVPQNAVP